MIRIIDFVAAERDRPLLRSMFGDRKRLFVDLLGWDIPVVDDAYEIDQFDNSGTVYLVAVEPEGGHAASLRLLPTTVPHMLGTLFADLCPLGVPAGPKIWEASRLCLPQRHGATRRRALRNLLFSAAVDFALGRGIERLTGLVPDAFRTQLLAMGWHAEPLGPAFRMPGGPVGAFMVHVGSDTPQRLGWTGVYVPTNEGAAA